MRSNTWTPRAAWPDEARRLRQNQVNILSPQARHFRLCFAPLQTAGWFLLVLAAVVILSSSGAAQADQPSEYEVKAAFLFNFTKFVEWPDGSFDDPHSPIVIGIVGDDPFGDSLVHIISGQKAQGRPIVIVKYRRGDDLRRCHILFISDSERPHTRQLLAGLRDVAILTVSDIDGFAEAGGAMQFVMQENRVHFVANLDAATQSKLHVSAKLLALARVINHRQAEVK